MLACEVHFMSKSLSTFKEILTARMGHKFTAARSRLTTDADAEKPKEVILAACAAIGDRLKTDGFEFHKSGPKLKRTAGDLTFEITFRSDRHNVAGRRAAVWIYANIISAKYANWARKHPHPWIRDLALRQGRYSGMIFGSQIGNLAAQQRLMEWDFADASCRMEEIEDAAAAIRETILPYISLFGAPAKAVDILLHDQGKLFARELLSYALIEFGQTQAEEMGRSLLKAIPWIRSKYEPAYRRFRQKGLPKTWISSGLGRELAALAIVTGLDLNVAA